MNNPQKSKRRPTLPTPKEVWVGSYGLREHDPETTIVARSVDEWVRLVDEFIKSFIADKATYEEIAVYGPFPEATETIRKQLTPWQVVEFEQFLRGEQDYFAY